MSILKHDLSRIGMKLGGYDALPKGSPRAQYDTLCFTLWAWAGIWKFGPKNRGAPTYPWIVTERLNIFQTFLLLFWWAENGEHFDFFCTRKSLKLTELCAFKNCQFLAYCCIGGRYDPELWDLRLLAHISVITHTKFQPWYSIHYGEIAIRRWPVFAIFPKFGAW